MPLGTSDEEVGYGIAGGNLGNVFGVDSNSGRVFVNRSLDFETVARFELWVKTFYKTKPLFFVAKKVVVEVKDKNDNAPQFENQLVKVGVIFLLKFRPKFVNVCLNSNYFGLDKMICGH